MSTEETTYNPFIFPENGPVPTAREVYEAASSYLLTLKKQSSKDVMCLYRGGNGLMCVVGFFIPNHCYSPKMDSGLGPSIGALLHHFHDKLPSWMHLHEPLLQRLQEVHDNLANWGPTGLNTRGKWYLASVADSIQD